MVEIYSKYKDVKLVDIMDGSIYEIPEGMLEIKENGVLKFNFIPVKDTPLILTFGNFLNN